MGSFFRWLLVLITLIVIAVYAPFPSRQLTFPTQNCQCAIPYNWILTNDSHYLVQAKRPSGGAAFLLRALPAPASTTVNPLVMHLLDKLFVDEGYTILKEEQIVYKGQPAGDYMLRKPVPGGQANTYGFVVVFNGFIYEVIIAKLNADPQKDPQLEAAFNSFRLINSPQ